MHENQKQGNNFSKLVNGNFDSGIMNKLSESSVPDHMTVFEYVDSVPAGTAPSTFGLFKKVDTHMTLDPPYPGSSLEFRVRCKAVQQNTIITKRLIIKSFYEKKPVTSSVWTKHKTDFKYDSDFDNKANVKYSGSWHIKYPGSEMYEWHTDVKKLKWKAHSGKLNDWYGHIRFYYKDQYGATQLYTFYFEKP